MRNCLKLNIPPAIKNKDILMPLRIYDLKGSSVDRTANAFASIHKDNNFKREIVLDKKLRIELVT